MVPLSEVMTPKVDVRIIEKNWWPKQEDNLLGYRGGVYILPVCSSDKTVAMLLAERNKCDKDLLFIEVAYWRDR